MILKPGQIIGYIIPGGEVPGHLMILYYKWNNEIFMRYLKHSEDILYDFSRKEKQELITKGWYFEETEEMILGKGEYAYMTSCDSVGVGNLQWLSEFIREGIEEAIGYINKEIIAKPFATTLVPGPFEKTAKLE